jgi:hypothetical protein
VTLRANQSLTNKILVSATLTGLKLSDNQVMTSSTNVLRYPDTNDTLIVSQLQ